MLAIGFLLALGVGFMIPRRPAEDLIERILQYVDREGNKWGQGGKMPALVVSIILITVIYGLDSTYSYGVIGLLLGFATNFAIFILWR